MHLEPGEFLNSGVLAAPAARLPRRRVRDPCGLPARQRVLDGRRPDRARCRPGARTGSADPAWSRRGAATRPGTAEPPACRRGRRSLGTPRRRRLGERMSDDEHRPAAGPPAYDPTSGEPPDVLASQPRSRPSARRGPGRRARPSWCWRSSAGSPTRSVRSPAAEPAGRRPALRGARDRDPRPRPVGGAEARRLPLPAQVPGPAGQGAAVRRRARGHCSTRSPTRPAGATSTSTPTSPPGWASGSAVAAYPPRRRRRPSSRCRPRSVALQVTDRDAAQKGLQRLVDGVPATDGGDPAVGWAFSGDYALLAETTAIAEDSPARPGRSSLAQDPHFAADVAAAEDGVLSPGPTWGLPGSRSALAASCSAPPRGCWAARPARVAGRPWWPGSTARTSSRSSAGRPAPPPPAGRPTRSPAWTSCRPRARSRSAWPTATSWCRKPTTRCGAASASRGSDLDDAVASLEHDYGIRVPDDLAVLLGDNLVAALDGAESDSSSRSAPA